MVVQLLTVIQALKLYLKRNQLLASAMAKSPVDVCGLVRLSETENTCDEFLSSFVVPRRGASPFHSDLDVNADVVAKLVLPAQQREVRLIAGRIETFCALVWCMQQFACRCACTIEVTMRQIIFSDNWRAPP